MKSFLEGLEKQLAKVGKDEVVTIRQDTLGLYGMGRNGMIQWLKERGFTAVFISETQSIEAKRDG